MKPGAPPKPEPSPPDVDLGALREQLRREAIRLGFVRCGFAAVAPLPHDQELQRWIDEGLHADLEYMERQRHERAHPKKLLASAQSAIVVAASYARHDLEEPPGEEGKGRIARYARGPDYHRVLRGRLAELSSWLEGQWDGVLELRVAVDTSPLLERELAMAAGIGFIGKNTMLITPGVGSYTVLGVLLCSLPFGPDSPSKAHCGRCTRCLDHCPTAAFPAPHRLDARRCISYLTIENRGDIPSELSQRFGDRVFGCDACQACCPYNTPTRRMREAAPDPELAPDPGLGMVPLAELRSLRSGAYRRLVRGRALARLSRPNWIRNACAIIEEE